MTFSRPNPFSDDPVRKAEETLRTIANLPAPDGLADRVQARLRSAPRSASVLNWRSASGNGWMFSPAVRGAAAAAIVCVVVGGGWQIYSHVPAQPAPIAHDQNVVLPARVGGNGSFSNSGAMARPDTLNGPVVAPPAPKAENTITHPDAKQTPKIVPAQKQAKGKRKAAQPAR